MLLKGTYINVNELNQAGKTFQKSGTARSPGKLKASTGLPGKYDVSYNGQFCRPAIVTTVLLLQ